MSNKNEIITAYTLQQCNSCKEQSKQKFSDGDYVFKEISKCSSCDAKLPDSHNFNIYVVNDEVGIYIKHSTSRKKTWRFSFINGISYMYGKGFISHFHVYFFISTACIRI